MKKLKIKDKHGKAVFSVFMWQINKLSDEEMQLEIDNRIKAARRYFSL